MGNRVYVSVKTTRTGSLTVVSLLGGENHCGHVLADQVPAEICGLRGGQPRKPSSLNFQRSHVPISGSWHRSSQDRSGEPCLLHRASVLTLPRERQLFTVQAGGSKGPQLPGLSGPPGLAQGRAASEGRGPFLED